MSLLETILLNLIIPSFNSPSIGLYHTIGKIEGLPYPEAVFDGSFFRSNPKPFYKLVSQIYPQRLEPTATHRFFTLLHQKVGKHQCFNKKMGIN